MHQVDRAAHKRIVFLWDQFGPYHVDRVNAVELSLGHLADVVGCQFAASSNAYAWEPVDRGTKNFLLLTLFPGLKFEETTWTQRLRQLVPIAGRTKVLFLAGYERPDIFLTALISRLFGNEPYLMLASKFEDRKRFVLRELIKAVLLLPYCGALVGGQLQEDYTRLLGFKRRKVCRGYNTVDLDRVRRSAHKYKSEEPERYFIVVARLVEKKNLSFLLQAYARYASLAYPRIRKLMIVGDGPMRAELELLISQLGLEGYAVILGFLQSEAVSEWLSFSLALLLPSKEEQWGLVINEALAFSLPVIVSDKVGARNDLVRVFGNGYVLEADNIEGWAGAMQQLANDSDWWLKMSSGSSALAPRADTVRFAEGVSALTGIRPEK